MKKIIHIVCIIFKKLITRKKWIYFFNVNLVFEIYKSVKCY